MSGVIVVNPVAGSGRAARLWPRLAGQLKGHGLADEVCLTTAPGVASDLTRRALRAGHETVIAVGGDGTINEVVNGFFAAGELVNPAARLGIVCCGTGADFVKSIGLPSGLAAVPHLAAGRTVSLDLGLATFRGFDGLTTERFFLNFADLGMGGETVARVNRTTKTFGGFASFLWGAVATILSYRYTMAEIVLDDGEPVQQIVGDVVAANGQYFAGGMHVAPSASLTDGLFDVFVLGEASKRELIGGLLPRVYRGAHVGHPKVWWRRARRLIVRSPERMLVDMDGELAGMADAEFRVLPRTLPVIVPAGFRDEGD